MRTASPLQLAASSASSASPEYEGFIGWVLSLIDSLGEVGVGLAVLIENFFPPIPSEAILPVAGFLAYEGRMSFWWALFAATLGSLIGAWVWYGLGAALGRDRTRWIFEKMPLVDAEDFDKAEAFFARWGGLAVLLGRCVPIVRSFISIPAGVERMSLITFSLYSALGSLVWNAIWIGLGFAFGPAIKPVLEQWSGVLSKVVIGVVLALLAWFVIARLRRNARRRQEAASAGEASTDA